LYHYLSKLKPILMFKSEIRQFLSKNPVLTARSEFWGRQAVNDPSVVSFIAQETKNAFGGHLCSSLRFGTRMWADISIVTSVVIALYICNSESSRLFICSSVLIQALQAVLYGINLCKKHLLSIGYLKKECGYHRNSSIMMCSVAQGGICLCAGYVTGGFNYLQRVFVFLHVRSCYFL